MNLTPPKLSADRILQLTTEWRTAAHLVDQDRAELSRHFNGGALQEDEDSNRTRRANILLGYKFLDRPVMQLLSTYDDGPGFLAIKVKNPDILPSRRRIVEQEVNRCANEVIQESERFHYPYRANIGDAVLNGVGTLYQDDPYDWAPKYGRPYYAWDAPADITNDKFTDWCFLGSLILGNIITRLDRLKKVPEEDSTWNRTALKNLAEKMARRCDPEQGASGFQTMDIDDPLAWREWIQSQTWGAQAFTSASACPVVWFFSKRFDKEYKRPVDLYCVARFGEQESVRGDKLSISTSDNQSEVLFHQEAVFDDVRKCFFPFMLSCMVGGEPLMRRVMGLGALMYDLDIRVQTSINNMFDGSDFDFAPLFQAQDSQSEAELQELGRTKIRPYDILPTGARFAEKPKGNRPYSSVFELTQLMSSEMGAQAQAFHGGGEFESKGRAELEVQVLERKQQLVTMLRLRMGDFLRRGDPMCSAIGHVLINDDALLECDRAWAEREALKAKLKDAGVMWEEVAGHCTFQMRRIPGHGDPGLALTRAQQTEVITRGAGPRAHRLAQRNLVSQVNGGDTQLAQELFPDEQETSGEQEQQALAQCSMCLTTGMPAPVLESDNPMAHVPIQMQVVQNRFTMAQEQGMWTRTDQRGWEALVAHTIADTRILGAFQPEAAKKVEQALQSMMKTAAGIQIGGIQPPVDPIAAGKLQLSAREQQRKEVKTQDDIRHRNESQEHREHQAEFQQNLQLAHLSDMEKNSQVGRATKITKAAQEMVELEREPEAA